MNQNNSVKVTDNMKLETRVLQHRVCRSHQSSNDSVTAVWSWCGSAWPSGSCRFVVCPDCVSLVTQHMFWECRQKINPYPTGRDLNTYFKHHQGIKTAYMESRVHYFTEFCSVSASCKAESTAPTLYLCIYVCGCSHQKP